MLQPKKLNHVVCFDCKLHHAVNKHLLISFDSDVGYCCNILQ